MKTVHLSIVIVNWNTRELLYDALNSIYTYTQGISYEIVVVDNASTDDSVEMIRREFPLVKVLQNSENLGFARANNQGAAYCNGTYLLLLNSDTKITHDVFTYLCSWMDARAEVGICGPKLLNPDGSLQPSAGHLPSLVGILGQQGLPLHILPGFRQWWPVLQVPWDKYYTYPHMTGWVMGACFLIRRDLWTRLGGLDEHMFMYVEEVELCKRAADLGTQIWICPDVSVYHLVRGSSVTGKKNAILGVYRGLYYYFSKHMPFWQKPILAVILKFGALIRMPRAFAMYAEAIRISSRTV